VRGAIGVGLIVTAAIAAALGGGVGCNEGNGLGAGDMTQVDLLPPADLVPPVDLVPPPNCGKIVFCALGCLGGGGIPGVGGGGASSDMSGANAIGCVLGCGQNAPPAEVTSALTLIACAAQSCLAADGGASGGGQLGILQCLQTQCPMQLAACKGLGIGG
jgi:hypothetical protein